MSEIPLGKSYSKRTFTASFAADPELWSGFKGVCAQRGVSICYVLEGLMMAWMEAQKVQATILQPVHIELHMEHVVERPRRKGTLVSPWEISRAQSWPPSCEHADKFLQGPKEVGCLDLQEWVSLEKCWRCFLASHP